MTLYQENRKKIKQALKRIKQEVREDNQGIRHNVCPKCNEIILYPYGVYFRNGVEVHTSCVVVLRMTRGKIAGVDYNV